MHNRTLALLFALICPVLGAQQLLNNDAVVKLEKAGLSDDLIISTINSQAGNYDTSPDGLIALKSGGVSDKVVAAIVTKINSPAPTSSGAQPQTVARLADQAGPPLPSAQLAPPSGTPTVQAPQTPSPTFHSTDGKLRIYVTDHPIFESNGIARAGGHAQASAFGESSNAAATWGAAASTHTQAGDDPRTVEVQADIQKVCPANIIASNNPDRADYVLVFRRRGGERSSFFAFGGLTGLALSAVAKVDGASLFQNDGDMIYATKQNTVEKAIKDVCEHLPK
jgi:hypothetical protein